MQARRQDLLKKQKQAKSSFKTECLPLYPLFKDDSIMTLLGEDLAKVTQLRSGKKGSEEQVLGA